MEEDVNALMEKLVKDAKFIPHLRISTKPLGELQINKCKRCFWIKQNVKLPYQMFPGIFSSIDSYVKSVVHTYFDKNGKLPEWLDFIDDTKAVYSSSSAVLAFQHNKARKFEVKYKNVVLTGEPDDMFFTKDGQITIIDYKTARHPKQDTLIPMYEAQVNGYAYIAEKLGLGTVKSLYLLYLEPPEKEKHTDIVADHTTVDGFRIPFTTQKYEVKKDLTNIERLMDEAYAICSLPKPPEALSGCEECEKIKDLINTAI